MIDNSPDGMAVNVANFPDKKPPTPREAKNIPINVLTFLRLASIVTADKPTGDSNISAAEMVRYVGIIANGDNKLFGRLV